MQLLMNYTSTMNQSDSSKTELVVAAIEIISENFGSYTAKLYQEYYMDKSPQQIYESVQELLNEVVGPTKTAEILKKLNNPNP